VNLQAVVGLTGDGEIPSRFIIMTMQPRNESSFQPTTLAAQRKLYPATRPSQPFELE
jgi:hypothetical protein